jgi:hypothetical protein
MSTPCKALAVCFIPNPRKCNWNTEYHCSGIKVPPPFLQPPKQKKSKREKLLECFSTQPFVQHEEEEEETQTKRASELHPLTSRLLGDLVLDNIDFINGPGFREHGGQLLLRKLPRQLTYKQLNGI